MFFYKLYLTVGISSQRHRERDVTVIFNFWEFSENFFLFEVPPLFGTKKMS